MKNSDEKNRLILSARTVFTLLTAYFLIMFPTPGFSQNPDYFCFMRMLNGNIIDLSKLCAKPSKSTTSERPLTEPTANSGLSVEQVTEALENGKVIYAYNYCQARTRGLTSSQASQQATGTVTSALVGVSSNNFTSEWFQDALSQSSLLCPDY